MRKMVPVENCTGCSACASSCPKEAISMVEDTEGFLYPQIDPNNCDSCGNCFEICPAKANLRDENSNTDEPTVYAGWTTDSDLLRKSTSGGAFSEIAKIILDKNGVVFGAAYDKALRVRHIGVDKVDHLQFLRGSKYVQSDVEATYLEAGKHLKSGRSVLYSGTPCQIAGLYAAIGKYHPDLVTCDLICHGVPSPKVFRIALEALEERYCSKIVDISFRDKRNGWQYPSIRIELADGSTVFGCNTDNHFYSGFVKSLYLRPACHACQAKMGWPVADITLGDFWGMSEKRPSLENFWGTSAVLVNSDRGRELVGFCAAQMILTEVPFAYMKESNLRKSALPAAERRAFFDELDSLRWDELVSKYLRPRNIFVRRVAEVRRAFRRWSRI